jgi:hypothetical protein
MNSTDRPRRALRSLSEGKHNKTTGPPLDFLDVVHQTNHIAILIQKHFHQLIVRLSIFLFLSSPSFILSASLLIRRVR